MMKSFSNLPANPIDDDAITGMVNDGAELFLAFQPQVDLRTGKIVSAEALVRWNHPIFGPIPPASFLPAIRRLRLHRELFRHVSLQALEALGVLGGAGFDMPIAINACADTLSDPASLESLYVQSFDLGIPLSRLRVEITEDVPIAIHPGLGPALTRLRQWGCEVALDDFGAGHANMGALVGLDIDELKLDWSLVSRINNSPVALASVRFALELGSQMNWRITAEGISSHTELRTLHTLGCVFGQGFLLGRPMPLAQLIARLEMQDDEDRRALWAGPPVTASSQASLSFR